MRSVSFQRRYNVIRKLMTYHQYSQTENEAWKLYVDCCPDARQEKIAFECFSISVTKGET